MRIVYFTEWDAFNYSGVLSKIEGQTEVWKNLGHEVFILLISTTEKESSVPVIESKVFSNKYLQVLPNGFFKTYLNKIMCIKSIHKEIKRISPDLIYYRQAIWYPDLCSLFSKYPTVMELNTDDVSEIRLFGKFKSLVYLCGRNKILKKISAFVAVSHEIGNLYSVYNKPVKVIANGFNFSNVPHVRKENCSRAQVLFVGSPNQDWHGIDKIIIMAKLLPEFDFHLVGPDTTEVSSGNLFQHGYLNKNDLYKLYLKIDIGIGSLALHRKKMNEASPLKVREYAAFGIPVIAGYKDTDLEGQPFLLNIGNHEKNVEESIPQIKKFIEFWKGKSIDRKLAEGLLSFKNKEKERLEYFSGIIQQS